MKRLSLLCFILDRWAQAQSTDLFLLSGQSNMIGHTTSGQSIGKNGDMWQSIKGIIENGGDAMEDDLELVIRNANVAVDSIGIVSPTEAAGLVALYNDGLLNNLDNPLTFGNCSFVIPRESGGVDDISGGTVRTVWDANCGQSFGHELMFSRALELKMNQDTAFETVKLAVGGTEIYRHWYPEHGIYWNALSESIANKAKSGGNWKGFIWHQGTQGKFFHYYLSLCAVQKSRWSIHSC